MLEICETCKLHLELTLPTGGVDRHPLLATRGAVHRRIDELERHEIITVVEATLMREEADTHPSLFDDMNELCESFGLNEQTVEGIKSIVRNSHRHLGNAPVVIDYSPGRRLHIAVERHRTSRVAEAT
jgi:hypothetical protein